MNWLTTLVSRLSILTKEGDIQPFRPNWAQSIILEEFHLALQSGTPLRNIVLKARQLGVSTVIEAYIYVMSFVIPNQRAAVIADQAPNSAHLLSMTDLYWETDPYRSLYTTKYQARNVLHWVADSLPSNSSVQTMTAGSKQAGRSRTLHQLHCSELGFWLEPDLVMTGLLQAVPTRPRTLIALESTANGIGNYFYDQWARAMSHDSQYVPLFFPWWMHPEYRASYLRLTYQPLAHLDEEERNLVTLFKVGLQVGTRRFTLPDTVIEDALAWRRYSIKNDCGNDLKKFHQEYPATPEEAFIATGTNVFPIQHINVCFKELPFLCGRLHRSGATVSFQPDIAGPFKVYKKPSPNQEYGIYTVGGDATATMTGDFACAQILNRRTLEQVATYRGRIDPARFAEELAKIGVYYNYASVAPENEGPGFSTIGALLVLDYPNIYQPEEPDGVQGNYTGKYGFSSTYKSKEDAVGWLLKLIVDHSITVHDRETYSELCTYVTLPGGGYGNAGGAKGHDDLVMALAIAAVVTRNLGPVMAYGGGAQIAREERQVEQMPEWAQGGWN